jgi:uncharacterized tellurite resistance protein B-like protein
MPIAAFLGGRNFDREATRVFEITRVALGHVDQSDRLDIAKKMIELAEAGETNPDRLCEQALNYVQQLRAPK